MKGNRERFRFVRLCMCLAVCAACAQPVCRAGQTPDNAGRRRQEERRRHDPLPSSFSSLDSYEQIALEPYREQYDRMPYHEKADVYSRMFEFMNNRKPDFSPDVLERIRHSGETGGSRAAAWESLYKGAPPPRGKTAKNPDAEILDAIPMPWKNREPEEASGEEARPAQEEEEDHRMESLRYGRWNLRREAEERKAP